VRKLEKLTCSLIYSIEYISEHVSFSNFLTNTTLARKFLLLKGSEFVNHSFHNRLEGNSEWSAGQKLAGKQMQVLTMSSKDKLEQVTYFHL
jgi:hypothetical protein